MDLEIARIKSKMLMLEHGLIQQGWEFEFSRQKFGLGYCSHWRKTIFVSRHYVELNPWEPEMKDTVLHEMAHALVGSGHGHDWTWKSMCRKIGAKPNRLASASSLVSPERNPEKQYIARCSCGKIFRCQRRGRHFNHYICSRCKTSLTFQPNPAYYTWTPSRT